MKKNPNIYCVICRQNKPYHEHTIKEILPQKQYLEQCVKKEMADLSQKYAELVFTFGQLWKLPRPQYFKAWKDVMYVLFTIEEITKNFKETISKELGDIRDSYAV